jgi:hypothetical protein
MAGKPGPFNGIRAFLIPLLRSAPPVVKPHNPSGWPSQIRHPGQLLGKITISISCIVNHIKLLLILFDPVPDDMRVPASTIDRHPESIAFQHAEP